MLVALELDASHFDLGPFPHYKSHPHRRRRYRPYFRTNGRELVSVLRQQLLNHDLSLLYLGRIVLRLRRNADFFLLEAVKNVTLRNRIDANVADVLDSRPLLDVDVEDPAFGSGFALEADVLKIVRVPKRVE